MSRTIILVFIPSTDTPQQAAGKLVQEKRGCTVQIFDYWLGLGKNVINIELSCNFNNGIHYIMIFLYAF